MSADRRARLLAAGAVGLTIAGIGLALSHAAWTATIAVLALVIGCILAIWRILDVGRIRTLSDVARAFATGKLDSRAAIGGTDALSRLGHELNELGACLAQQHAALEQQRRLLDGALGSLSEGVACVDARDLVAYANPAWHHLANGGAPPSGPHFYEHLTTAALSAAITTVRSGGRALVVEFEHRRRQLRAAVAPGPDVVVVVLHDLTELKRLESARRDFVASVSHELKTPLTAIAGFADTLLDGGLDEDPATVRGFVEKIVRHAERLTVLVRDVLTLSRLEQGAWEVKPETLDLAELGGSILHEHSLAAAWKRVRLELDCPAPLTVVSDRELLRQLIGNLVSNAVRYNRPDGLVRLELSGDERIRIVVRDTGIGIPAEHRERIFDRFYRVDAHRSRQSGGTGLGLAIVRQLVETLQGTIRLESSSAGAVFTIDLPRRDARAP